MSNMSSLHLAADDNKSAQFAQRVYEGALTALPPTQIGFFIFMRSVDAEISGDALKAYITEIF